jgi:hypothetical protein
LGISALLSGNDDYGPACNSLQSSLAIPVLSGNRYLIEIGGFSTYVGPGVLTTSCAAAPQGACCTTMACYIDYELACAAAGGAYLGDNTICAGADCNNNAIDDACDIAGGLSQDCNANGIPDDCDIVSGYSHDCDGNGAPDECEIRVGDLNCDCSANFANIHTFVHYLSNFSTWLTTYVGCLPQNGDTNGDGTYPSCGDINPFVTPLSGGGRRIAGRNATTADRDFKPGAASPTAMCGCGPLPPGRGDFVLDPLYVAAA